MFFVLKGQELEPVSQAKCQRMHAVLLTLVWGWRLEDITGRSTSYIVCADVSLSGSVVPNQPAGTSTDWLELLWIGLTLWRGGGFSGFLIAGCVSQMLTPPQKGRRAALWDGQLR